MDVIKAIRTRIEVRQFSGQSVSPEVKREVLDAARLASSGMNTQHWRFILIDSKEDLQELADLSKTGKWVAGANFAIVVLTDPKYAFHLIDAGRAITHMQLTAWEHGVGSCMYTGLDASAMKEVFKVPENLSVSAVLGFGYPAKSVIGKKRRLPLGEIAFLRRYGQTSPMLT